MASNQLRLFTDRYEAVELFKLLRESAPEAGQHWPLFPILSYVAPVGSGKTLLIEHLRERHCSDPELPHILIDFAEPTAPKQDLLLILTEIRNKLQKRKDAQGKHLSFPRFDFAAAIALAALEESNTHRLSAAEIKQRLTKDSSLLDDWTESANALGNIVPLVPLALAALRSTMQIEPLDRFLRWLEEGPVWEWYQERAEMLRLPHGVKIDRIIRRLDEMSAPGEASRTTLVEQILPEALLADLREELDNDETRNAWPGAKCAIIFFNHFEILMDDPGRAGRRLLEILTLTEHRRRGETDPLLLVIASQQPLLTSKEPDTLFEPGPSLDERTARDYIREVYSAWRERLPAPGTREELLLKHLYLPLVLRDFDLTMTRSYLQQFGKPLQKLVFDDPTWIERLHSVTKGHPLYLSLVAAAIRESGSDYKDLIDLKNLTIDTGEKIADHLLGIFLQRLERDERRNLTYSAIARELDVDILHIILQGVDNIDIEELLAHYRHLPFVRVKNKRLKMHPLVRSLLLQKLTSSPEATLHTHERLRTYFHKLHLKKPGDDYARLEEVYHALALSDPQPAIELGCQALEKAPDLWEPLLEVVSQAPTGPLAEENDGRFQLLKSSGGLTFQQAEEQAKDALSREMHSSSLVDGVKAVVLYRWLVATNVSDGQKANFLGKLANAYTHLKSGNRQRNLEVATAYFGQALDLHNRLAPGPKPLPTPSAPLPAPDPSTAQTVQLTQPAQTGQGTQQVQPVTNPPPVASVAPPAPSTKPATQVQAQTRAKSSQGATRRPRRSLAGRLSAAIRSLLASRLLLTLLIVVVIICVILASFSLPIFQDLFKSPAQASQNPLIQQVAPQLAAPDARGIGVTPETNGSEYVGLSDGLVPFDISRPDHDLKVQASRAFSQHHIAQAMTLWQQAHQEDPNDAEVMIYLENQQVQAAGGHCIFLVVATNLSGDAGDAVTVGRDDLQGAYVVQKEHNDGPNPLKICLLVANVGSDPSYVDNVVVGQIARAGTAFSIKGVMGWPGLSLSPHAVSVLNNINIPIVSPDNYNTSDKASNLFHVVPSNNVEGMKDALYAENVLKATRILLLYDLSDPYSSGLRDGFKAQLMQDGKSGVLVGEVQYAAGCINKTTQRCQQTPPLASLLASHASSAPDVIYFAGGAADGEQLLAGLTTANMPTTVRILGGDELYQLIAYPGFDRPNFQYLDFTAFAYPDQVSVGPMKQHYAQDFDQGDNQQSPVRSYGYSRPDSAAILAADAMSALIDGIISAWAQHPQFTVSDVQNVLRKVQVAGASRTIAFTEDLEPVDATMVVLRVNAQGYIQNVSHF